LTTEHIVSELPNSASGRPGAAPILIGVAGVILAIAVFTVLFLGERTQRADESRLVARETLARIVNAVEVPMRSIERMSKRWETLGYTLREQWIADARNYLDDVPSLQSLIWSDQNLIKHWIVDRSGNVEIVGLDDKQPKSAQKQPMRDSDVQPTSGPRPLIYGGPGFVYEIPLRDAWGKPAGYLRAIFRYSDLFAEVTKETAASYHLTLKINGQMVYGTDAFLAQSSRSAVIGAQGEDWRLFLMPKQSLLSWDVLFVPVLLAILTLAMGLMAASAVHFRVRASHRARQANEARNRMQAAIEALDSPFAFFDNHDRLVNWNRAFRDLHDPFRELVVSGVSYGDLVRGAIASGSITEALGREESFYESRMELHAGEGFILERRLTDHRWLQTNEQRTQDGSTVMLLTDISDQKQREDELKAQRDSLSAVREKLKIEEEKFRTFAEASADWFWITDADHRYTWLSDAIEKFTGGPREMIYGTSRVNLGQPAHSDEEWENHLGQLERREPFRDILLHWDSPQGEAWIRSSGIPQFDDDGTFTGYLGSGKDITDLMLAEHRYHIVRDQLEMAIDAISEGLMIFDPEDRLVLCNDNFRVHNPAISDSLELGQDYVDIIQRASQSVVPDRWTSEERQNWMHRRLNLRDSDNPVMEFETQLGEWCRITEYRTANGGTVMVRSDITDLKLRQQDLEIERNNAEQANRAKTDFLTNMSHELRTPLNAIIGFADVMTTGIFGPLEGRYASYAGDIGTSGRHLLSLINDLLDGARIESGKYDLVLEELSLEEQLRQAVILMQPLFDKRDLLLDQGEADLSGTIIRVDERALRQILLNIMSNAVKFSHQKGHIGMAVLTTGSDLEIRIRDHGIGLPDPDLERVFERFVQVQDPMHRSHDGTGIGLPLSRSLAELHGGSLHLEKEAAEGVTAVLRLPGVVIANEPTPMRSIA
jgi:PAS domain S-box-containing protein